MEIIAGVLMSFSLKHFIQYISSAAKAAMHVYK